jgi:phosphocarrier protein HPr
MCLTGGGLPDDDVPEICRYHAERLPHSREGESPPGAGSFLTGTRSHFVARKCKRCRASAFMLVGRMFVKEMGIGMQERVLTIMNRLGLHARAAAKLVTLASRYASSVVLVANGRRADARHFIAVLMLSASMGTAVSIQVSGPDEAEAMKAMARLISNGFGEG